MSLRGDGAAPSLEEVEGASAVPRPPSASSPPPPRVLLAGALFIATLAATLWVGGMHGLAVAGFPDRPLSRTAWLFEWIRLGSPYALSLIGILLCHEMGHWLLARRYRVATSLPYFLPMPLTMVGTLGAFIQIRSPFPNRKALLDVGLAGPFAGFVVCLPLLAIGIADSRIGVPDEGTMQLGEPLIFRLFAWLFASGLGEGEVLYLSPMGLAAWFGVLVTAINLLPMGQLDGGHALYATVPDRAWRISRTIHLLMFPLAVLSPSWLIWGLLCLLLGARRRHPPTLDDAAPLPRSRRLMAWAGLATFAVCFTPEPIVMDWSLFFG